MHVKRLLCAQHPHIETDVIKFIEFVRSERVPVMGCHIKLEHYVQHEIAAISNFVHQIDGRKILFDNLPFRDHSNSIEKLDNA